MFMSLIILFYVLPLVNNTQTWLLDIILDAYIKKDRCPMGNLFGMLILAPVASARVTY